MVHEVNPVQRTTGVQGSGEAPPPGKYSGRFEALLGELTREMEALKQGDAAAEIRKPEDLEAALNEAGRKFQSCEKVKKNLIEAYQATVAKMKDPPSPLT